MDASREDLLRDYLQRVTKLREEMRDDMTFEQVQEVARELGMSQSDLAAAAQSAAAHRERGIRYSQHDQHDDAVRELRDAVALDPFSADGLYALAEALQRRGASADRDEAITLARRVVDIDPRHERAYTLIRVLRGGGRERAVPSAGQSRTGTARARMDRIWQVIVIAGTLIVVLLILLPVFKGTEPSAPEPSAEPGGITVLPDPSSTEPAISVRSNPSSSAGSRLPVEFAWAGAHDGFDLALFERDRVVATEMIVGKTNGFETSHQITLEAENRSGVPIRELTLRFTDFDGNGRKLGTNQVVAIAPDDLPLPPGAKRNLDLRYPTAGTMDSYKLEVTTVK